jgi:hypothetical protein
MRKTTRRDMKRIEALERALPAVVEVGLGSDPAPQLEDSIYSYEGIV